jgi:hypothetical protein
MSDTCIIVKPTPGITSEEARNTRARAWRYVFDCHAKKNAAGTSGGEDHARKEINDSRAERILHDQRWA